MSSPVVTIEPRSTVESVAGLMLSNKVRHLLVVNADRTLVGIVAPTDLNSTCELTYNLSEKPTNAHTHDNHSLFASPFFQHSIKTRNAVQCSEAISNK